jgi:predicted nucleic acid-binding protein
VIVLDTNVLSEVMKSSPAPRVTRWLASQAHLKIFITSVTLAEIFFGLELMPRGRRRDALYNAATSMFRNQFADRVLAFDADASHIFAMIAAARKRAGPPIGQFDCQIAAIARSHGQQLRHATYAILPTAACN